MTETVARIHITPGNIPEETLRFFGMHASVSPVRHRPTAREAWRHIREQGLRGKTYQLIALGSDENIGFDGGALPWRCSVLLLPDMMCQDYELVRCDPKGDETAYAVTIVESEHLPNLFERSKQAFLPPEHLKCYSLFMTSFPILLRWPAARRWLNNAYLEAWRRDHPPLPETFTDSPEAVRALACQDINFISGSTGISISLRMIHTQPIGIPTTG